MHKDQGSEIQSNSMAFNSITLDQIVLGSNEAFGAMPVIYQVTHNGRRVYILLLCSHYQDMAYKPTRNQQGTVFSSQRIWPRFWKKQLCKRKANTEQQQQEQQQK